MGKQRQSQIHCPKNDLNLSIKNEQLTKMEWMQREMSKNQTAAPAPTMTTRFLCGDSVSKARKKQRGENVELDQVESKKREKAMEKQGQHYNACDHWGTGFESYWAELFFYTHELLYIYYCRGPVLVRVCFSNLGDIVRNPPN